MKSKLLVLIVIVLFAACATKKARSAQTEMVIAPAWAETTLTVIGIGAPPSEAENMAQARLLACNAAKMDAYRQLLESIKGVRIDASTSVKDLITQNDMVRTESEGFIKRAKIVKQEESEDGSCQVTMQLYLGKQFSDIVTE